MLNFLTGDRWTLGFRSRPNAFARLVPARLSRSRGASFDSVSLFSGGLDSLIGAIDLLEAKDGPLLVSHAGDDATSAPKTASPKRYRPTMEDERSAASGFGWVLTRA